MRILSALLLLIVVLIACADDEENSTVVGLWDVASHRVETVKQQEVQNDVTYHETGIIQFNGDGTGLVELEVPVQNFPNNQEFTWSYDSLGFVFVDYNDGKAIRKYEPTYRGRFLLLSGTQVTGTLGNITVTNSEILLRKK